ncbi:hypothetical protein P8452_21031 [Trifolium repens]|nr:hypothetical protein P8452_21031 [Trifolium repens]
MRIKSVVTGVRRRSITPSVSPIPNLSTTAQDNNHNATVYDSDTSNENHTHAPIPDFVPDTDIEDSLDENSCITCNKTGGALLVCTQTDCPITVHFNCIGSEPNFDDSGNFFCPYCSYKQAWKKTRELREKAVRAKNALSSFLDKGQTVHKDKENPPVEPVRPESVLDHVNRNEHEPEVSGSEKGKKQNDNDNDEDEDKGNVSESVSSVSETKDSDSSFCISVKKGRANAKPKVASVKKPVLPKRKAADADGGGGGGDDGGEEEEVTSSRSTISRRKEVKKHYLFTGKRRKLFWTAEEEKALKEGVLKFSTENRNIPWRKILEFGCRVFDSTRTPVDLKDKWRNLMKEGCKK